MQENDRTIGVSQQTIVKSVNLVRLSLCLNFQFQLCTVTLACFNPAHWDPASLSFAPPPPLPSSSNTN